MASIAGYGQAILVLDFVHSNTFHPTLNGSSVQRAVMAHDALHPINMRLFGVTQRYDPSDNKLAGRKGVKLPINPAKSANETARDRDADYPAYLYQ